MSNQKEETFSVETAPLDVVVIHGHSDGESTAPTISTDRPARSAGRKKRRKQGSYNPVQKKARRGHEVQHTPSNSDSSFQPPLKCSPSSRLQSEARLQGFDSLKTQTLSSRREVSLDSLGRESCMVTSEREEFGPASMTVEGSGEREFCQSAGNAGSEAGDEGTKWQQASHTAVAIFFNNRTEASKTETGIVGGTCNNNNRLMDNRIEKGEVEASVKRSTPSESDTNKHDRESNPPTSCDVPLKVGNSHMHTERVFHRRADGDRDITTRIKVVKKNNVVCDVTEAQQEANSDETISDCVYEHILHSDEFDKGACGYNAITCYTRIAKKYAASTEACINVIGINLPSHALQHFAVMIIDWLPVSAIELTVTFTKPLVTPPSMIKSHPNNSTCCIERLVNPEQESQFGYESHLSGGVMVNGHTLISNVSVMGSLRGDKANKSHNYSGFDSMRSKSGLEQFRDNNHNEATFASFRENRRTNYAQSSYRAKIVGGSNLAGAYSESDAAQQPLDRKQTPLDRKQTPLDHKQTPHIMNGGSTQDQKPVAGTFNYYHCNPKSFFILI